MDQQELVEEIAGGIREGKWAMTDFLKVCDEKEKAERRRQREETGLDVED
ncbi:hypothetical protein [[Eubacterium] cellulosolvens]